MLMQPISAIWSMIMGLWGSRVFLLDFSCYAVPKEYAFQQKLLLMVLIDSVPSLLYFGAASLGVLQLSLNTFSKQVKEEQGTNFGHPD